MLVKTTNFFLRLALGAVLLLAGALKVFNPAGFADSVQHYQMLPHEFINVVAIIMPWIELVAGVFLVMGVWVRASALLAALLSAIFMMAIGQALARGLNIECGCFGTVAGSRIGLSHLAVDVALLLTSVWLVRNATN